MWSINILFSAYYNTSTTLRLNETYLPAFGDLNSEEAQLMLSTIEDEVKAVNNTYIISLLLNSIDVVIVSIYWCWLLNRSMAITISNMWNKLVELYVIVHWWLREAL